MNHPTHSSGTTPFFQALVEGATAPFRGLLYLASHRELWPYAAAPFLLGLVWSGISLAEWSIPAGEAWWSTALWTMLRWFLEAGILFVQLLIALTAPLLDLLGEETEEQLGIRPQGPPFWKELFSLQFIRRSLSVAFEAGKLLAFKLLLFGIAAIVALIPVIGPWIAWPLSGVATGLDFVDYPLARRNWTLREKLDAVRAYWPAVLAFGLIVFALFEIPGLGGILLPPAVIGGTLLVARLGVLEYSAHDSRG
ncbi:MAG: hypothetical protein D6761_05095 [Candidatus Dadabacteria bacterium]|nr:MAG: hypothetical protein D6761_05095 [Candidatus Dadabacteria bacterium]